MDGNDIRDYDFTDAAWESLYDAVDDTQFLDKDAQLIYNSLKQRLKIRSFGDYLKRYIYEKAELTEGFPAFQGIKHPIHGVISGVGFSCFRQSLRTASKV